jgi:competence protein ComFC
MSVREKLCNLLFPPKCPFCGRVQSRPGICAECEAVISRTRGEEALRRLPGGFSCVAPLFYEGVVRDGLLRYKFAGAAGLSKFFGELVAECAAEHYSGAFDTVSWVPVSAKRLRKRRYDQARLLAEEACRCWQTKPAALLRKTTHNLTQSSLSDAAARRANVLGVYDPIHLDAIRDRKILLIDDICTTGATLAECARTLQDAGAASVMCAAVAFRRRNEGAQRENPCAEGKKKG